MKNDKPVIIEVGVNLAQDTEKLIAGFDDYRYFGFEPTYQLLPRLVELFKNHPNVVFIPLAVDIENRVAQFNIANYHDWGCSSLHSFSDDIRQTWPDNPAFFGGAQNVATIRLDDFCKLYGIDKIEKLHIDAQGNDFNVLKSLGSKIWDVKWGKLEVTYNVPLYKGVDNTHTSVIQYLEDHGFKYDMEFDATPQKCEANITFYK